MARLSTRIRLFLYRAKSLFVLEPPGYWSDEKTGKPVKWCRSYKQEPTEGYYKGKLVQEED